MGGQTVVPPTVARTIKGKGAGSLQHFDTKAHDFSYMSVADENFKRLSSGGGLYKIKSMKRTFLLDMIGANDDRHSGNLMIKVITKGGKKTYQAVAIDNGLSMPTGQSMGYRFAGASNRDFDKLIKFNKESIKEIGNLKMEDVAKIFHNQKLPREAARGAMVRIKAIQEDANVIHNLKPYEGNTSRNKINDFFFKSNISTRQLVSKEGLGQIDDALGAFYKKKSAARTIGSLKR